MIFECETFLPAILALDHSLRKKYNQNIGKYFFHYGLYEIFFYYVIYPE